MPWCWSPAASVDEARLASETLSWLEAHGRQDLVAKATVVINMAAGEPTRSTSTKSSSTSCPGSRTWCGFPMTGTWPKAPGSTWAS